MLTGMRAVITELEEAKQRIRNEELDADFYNHYTDDRIKELERCIE